MPKGFRHKMLTSPRDRNPAIQSYFSPIRLAKSKSLILMDKGLIPLVYKVLLQIDNEETDNPIQQKKDRGDEPIVDRKGNTNDS